MPTTSLQHDLRRIVPGRLVLARPAELLVYEADAGLDAARPDAVVLVESADDVTRLLAWARGRGLPVVARGAGTGISGGAVAEHGGLLLGFSRMNAVRSIDEDARLAVVEPGVVNADLDALARRRGLYFPPDPASGRTATIGGNIAENAGGPHCFKYGVTTNYVAGLDAVLADGRAVRLGGPSADYPEYDFVGLLTGSEGTLAITTAAVLRLIPAPPSVMTMLAAFDSVEQAGRAVSAIIAAGLVPSTLELMDRKMMRIVEDYAHAGLPVDAAAVLIIEVDGHEAGLAQQMQEIASELARQGVGHMRMAATEAERENLWHGRKSVAGAMARLAPAYFSVDVTVPRSKLAAMLGRVDAICAEAGLPVGHVLHAGDGNLHPDILLSHPGDPALMTRVHAAVREFVQVALELGGSITGEHGVGSEKRDLMPLMFSAAELSAMADVKSVFDPDGVLNPGKILPEAAGATPRPLPDPGAVGLAPCEPGSPAEAAEILAACCSWDAPLKNPVRIAGGGTKQITRLAPSPAGGSDLATLSTRKMQGIIACEPDDLYVTVRAGTRLADLQAELCARRVWVPLASPWPDATVGGIVAAACNAPLRLRYGSARDLALSANVVLPDGRIVRTGRPLVKNVAGYDMTKLFVGSYGTLGLIADVTFKLYARPRRALTLAWPAAAFRDAVAWGRVLLRQAIVGSAALACSKEVLPGWDAPFGLIFTAEGLEGDVTEDIARARAALAAAGASEPRDLEDATGAGLWAAWLGAAPAAATVLRVGGAPDAASGPPPAPFCLDLSCSVAHLIVDRSPAEDEGGLAAYLSGVRADGGYAVPVRGPRDAVNGLLGYRPDALDLMRRLKKRWDPFGCCNPGAFPLEDLA